MKTDRQKMHAALRAMRSAGIDAKHAEVRYPEPGVRLSKDPADLYWHDDRLTYVFLSWREGEADPDFVVKCLRDAGMLAERLEPFAGFYAGGYSLQQVVVAREEDVLAQFVSKYAESAS